MEVLDLLDSNHEPPQLPNSVLGEDEDKRKSDEKQRNRTDSLLQAKILELRIAKDRMYKIRYENIRNRVDLQQDLQTASKDVLQIQAEIQRILREDMNTFEESLKLSEVGLFHLLTDNSQDAHNEVYHKEVESRKAKENWQILLWNFKKWSGARKAEQQAIQEEIIKLRTSIYSLKQRKYLTTIERKRLQEMTSNLQALIRRANQLKEEARKKKATTHTY